MGSEVRFGIEQGHAYITIDSLNEYLSANGATRYHETAATVEGARREARATEIGSYGTSLALEHARRKLGRSCLLELCSALIPRRIDGVQSLANGYPIAGLEDAWREWLEVGAVLGIGDLNEPIGDEVARAIESEQPLHEGDDDDLVTMRQAWFCYYEAMRLARRDELVLLL